MHCPYCGCSNAEDEHRCRRCGRRLQPLAPVVYPVENSAAVRAPEPAAPAAATAQPETRPAPRVAPRQVPLFAAPERPNIIPFETIAPERVSARLRQTRAHRAAAARQPGLGPDMAGQQSLFPSAAAAARQPAAPRTAVRDEAAVAPVALRLQAAAADAGICAAGLAVAAVTFQLMGGHFAFLRSTALFWAGAAGAMVIFYHAFWSILGRETAGMRGCGLRLLTFDGHPPVWKQRVARLLAACLGIGALGLGVLWTLADEEKLAWHDHITKTFPTLVDASPSTFHRM
jgi:uncharacterized RDD family membrane protein YckC